MCILKHMYKRWKEKFMYWIYLRLKWSFLVPIFLCVHIHMYMYVLYVCAQYTCVYTYAHTQCTPFFFFFRMGTFSHYPQTTKTTKYMCLYVHMYKVRLYIYTIYNICNQYVQQSLGNTSRGSIRNSYVVDLKAITSICDMSCLHCFSFVVYFFLFLIQFAFDIIDTAVFHLLRKVAEKIMWRIE